MLRLSLSEEVETFRKGLKSWLKQNQPPGYEGDVSLENFQKVGAKWQAQLAKSKYIGVHWPESYGGRGLSLVEEAVVQEELARINSPQILGLFGLTMVGPVLIRHGNEEQKKRYLSKILSGEEIWCQGFSEPGAGSDLAAIKTTGEKVKDGFKISGQKVWTSFAHIADYCFALVRTSQEEKKHRGLTYLLVDMKEKGITKRPLRQISGDDEFNEVFFDEVFVPDENVVGVVGDGWKIAISTLMYERVVLTFSRHLQSETALRSLLELHSKDLLLEKELSSCVAEACAVRALAYEHLIEYGEGKEPGAEGSMDKLFWSESFQRIASLALKASGKNALLSRESESLHRYLYSRGRTIAAGTSEIQRSIIAERLLGLSKSR